MAWSHCNNGTLNVGNIRQQIFCSKAGIRLREAHIFFFEKISMKCMSLYMEVHNTLLGNSDTAAPQGAIPSPSLISVASACPACVLFHHSSMTRCSQAFVTFQVVKENIVLSRLWFFILGIWKPLVLQVLSDSLCSLHANTALICSDIRTVYDNNFRF
jgi:hypothetical protein